MGRAYTAREDHIIIMWFSVPKNYQLYWSNDRKKAVNLIVSALEEAKVSPCTRTYDGLRKRIATLLKYNEHLVPSKIILFDITYYNL
jgi:hypothetical protein